MQQYAFTAVWIPGKRNTDTDALSRATVDMPISADELTKELETSSARVALMSVVNTGCCHRPKPGENQANGSQRPNYDQTPRNHLEWIFKQQMQLTTVP